MTEQRIGQYFGRYQIVRRLGRGGMAEVYQAVDTSLKRNVALKIISQYQEDPAKFHRRFKREARALAQLSHPYILKILDFGEQDGLLYLVMEYMEGGTLSGFAKPMPYQRAARLLLPIADALHYAHQHGIIHRDVKPSNILINYLGQPMLADFGIAKLLESDESTELTMMGNAIGTPGYMSPEQGQGQKVDARTDIYALGVVFYELVTGVKPYTADTPMAVLHKQLTEPFINPRSLTPSLPQTVSNSISRALARVPEKRQTNMAELTRELEMFAKSAPRTLARQSLSRHLRWMSLVVFLFVIMGFLTGFLWNYFGVKTANPPNPVPTRVSSNASAISTYTKTPTSPPQITLTPTIFPTLTTIPTQTLIPGTIPISVENVKNIKLVNKWDYVNEFQSFSYFNHVLFSPDSQKLVYVNKEYKPISTCCSEFSKAYIIQRNILDGKIANTKEISLDLIDIIFKDNQLFGVTQNWEQPIIVWSLPNQTKISTLQTSSSPLENNITFSNDQSLLLGHGWDTDIIKGWNIANNKLLFTITKYTNYLNSPIGISPDNNLLAWIRLGTARVYSISKQQFLFTIDGLDSTKPINWFSSTSQNNTFFSPNGKFLILNSMSDGVQIINVNDGKLIRTLKRNEVVSNNYCWSGFRRVFAFSLDSRLLAVGDIDGSVAIWDIQSGNLLKVIMPVFASQCHYRDNLLFSPNGTFLLSLSSSYDNKSSSYKDEIQVWGISP